MDDNLEKFFNSLKNPTWQIENSNISNFFTKLDYSINKFFTYRVNMDFLLKTAKFHNFLNFSFIPKIL